MADEIDHWLDQLAGRAENDPDHPLDRVLVAQLRAESAPVSDALGLRRLTQRLESEGLLHQPPARRVGPRWLAIAASLMVAVSLGWWMLPEQALYSPSELSELRPTPELIERDSSTVAAEAAAPPAPATRQNEAPTVARSAPARSAADAASDVTPERFAGSAESREQTQREKASTQALRAYAAAPPTLLLPANADLDLAELRMNLDAVEGLQAVWWPPDRRDALRVRWADAAARSALVAALPEQLELPVTDESGQILLRWAGEGAPR